jgi:stage II sporulation protein D
MATALLLTLISRGPTPVRAGRPLPKLAERDPEIDVLLTAYDGADVVRAAAPRGWIASDAAGAEIARSASAADAAVSRSASGKLTLRGAEVAAPSLVLESVAGEPFTVGKSRYRGKLIFDAGPRGLRAVNRVPLEIYISSVVGSEMYASSTKPAALEAQAIAARTYARFEIEKRGRVPLPDSQEAQAYYGIDRETAATRAAAAATADKVLYYDGELLPSLYHSTCGGGTVDATELLGSPAPRPLRGAPCEFCKKAKLYRWNVAIPGAILDAVSVDLKLGKNLWRLDPRGDEATPWSTIELRGSSGAVTLAARKFRQAVHRAKSQSLLPSPFIQHIAGDGKGGVSVQGRGFGHGVGMCQIGAAEMGARGFTTKEILQQYYPGAFVESTERRGAVAFR